MRVKRSLLAVALGLASFAASADTLYAFDIAKHQTSFTSAKTFHEVYDFYLDAGDFPNGTADIGFAFTELRAKNAVNIDFGANAIKLFDNANNLIWQGTPTPAIPGTADSLSFDGVTVDTSHFSLTIDGTVVGTGPTKGSYSWEIVAGPVPEPEVYSLAIAGLALVGWAGRRAHAKRA